MSAPESEEEVVDQVTMSDGTEFVLSREGEDWMVRVKGRMLMSSRVVDSEIELAEEALARVPDAEEVLIGGLGLGFTLRAVLDLLPEDGVATVAELVPALVGWNHNHVGVLNDHPLDDPRCEVVVGNVLDVIKNSRERFDAIILDVDNGPVALSNEDNGRLYNAAGARACHQALRPHGILAVWSSDASARYERTLESADFEVDTVRVAAHGGARAQHVIFLGRRLPARGRGKGRR